MVRTTSFLGELGTGAADEQPATGRTVIAGFLAYRFSGLATGFAALVSGRRRFRSHRVATVQLTAATVESVWLARRLWRGGGTDAVASRVDAATAIATVAAVRANVTAGDRATFVNWAPWGFAAPAVAGQAMARPRISAGSVAGAAAIGAATSAALSDGPGEFVANMGAMLGLFAGGFVLGGQIRRGARRLEAARRRAVEEERLLAVEQERSRQLRLLHDSALQTLEAVAAHRDVSYEEMQARALEESERLQAEVDGGPLRTLSIAAEIERVIRRHVERGFGVDLTVEPVRDPPLPVVAAMRDACNEALTNAAKHAGVGHAVVRIEATTAGVRVIIRDRGVGFDPDAGTGFGTTESIKRRLADVGGRADIDSRPAEGTTVVLWSSP